MKPEDCLPGVEVLYQPIVKPDRPKYRGTVRELPWQLGDGTWVTHLKMGVEYTCVSGRTVVHGAALHALELAPVLDPDYFEVGQDRDGPEPSEADPLGEG